MKLCVHLFCRSYTAPQVSVDGLLRVVTYFERNLFRDGTAEVCSQAQVGYKMGYGIYPVQFQSFRPLGDREILHLK